MREGAFIGVADVAEMADEGARFGSAWLSESEQRRLEAITAGRRRTQFLAGRWALRKLIASELDADPLNCVLLAEENGPPRLAEADCLASNLHLSLSHSGDVVACAMFDGQVGIDIEVVRRQRPIVNLLEAALSPQEKRRIEELTEEDARSYFYAVWTLKEAWIKHAPSSPSIGLTQLPLIETARAAGKQPSNAWAWSGCGFIMALVAPAATAVHCCSALGGKLAEVVPAAWRVVPAWEAEVEIRGALG